MRIISGKFKGKKIKEPKDLNTRPLKDLTKESIFNLITHSNKFDVELKNSNVLDLFSGIGSFGLECLSRGSLFSTFVENYKDVLPILKQNIINLGVMNNSIIIEKDILNNFNYQIFNKKFDIIFIDPPYKEKKINLILTKILEANVLNYKGLIVIHRHKKNKDSISNIFKIIEERSYGISKIIFGSFS
ncbi:16S rRNA (guanine(966)-N(2))-methyltransferase RsmD [Candidatus Pelagibacter sp.]|nr:16S rRNA (guanine(966)-N(2))-methyltransferase RsmD [Candidatus Pelagibacter sp.]